MRVVVVPNAKRFEIEQTADGLKIRLRSKPENNRANRELLVELKKRARVPVSLVSGAKSRQKTVAFEGLSDAQVLERIQKGRTV